MRSLPTIHSSNSSLEQMNRFESICEMYLMAIFEAIEVKGQSMLNFEAGTPNFVIISESLAANLKKVMQNSSKILIYLTLILFFLNYLQE